MGEAARLAPSFARHATADAATWTERAWVPPLRRRRGARVCAFSLKERH